MANITEQDIIDHLQEKIEFHQQEIERLNNILSAFNNNPPAVTATASRKPAQNSKPAAEGSQNKPGKETKTKAHPALAPTAPAPALQVPEKYTDKLTTEEKIAYALTEISNGFVEDIAASMALYEPKSDAEKLKKQISGVLPDMRSKGTLQAERVGRKDKYWLTR